MSTKFNYKGMIAGLAIGASVGFVGITIIQAQQEDQAKELAVLKEESASNHTENRLHKELAQDDVERRIRFSKSWVDSLIDMPKTTERDTFATALYNATKDGEFSESEYDDMKAQHQRLMDYNTNQKTKEQATKILEGGAVSGNHPQPQTEAQAVNEAMNIIDDINQNYEQIKKSHDAEGAAL